MGAPHECLMRLLNNHEGAGVYRCFVRGPAELGRRLESAGEGESMRGREGRG